MERFYVYILASKRNGTLYIGVTNNLARRVDEHRTGSFSSFTSKYHVYRLAYYETYDDPELAIRREKNIKAWKRMWKLRLIESKNPAWEDFADQLIT